MNWAEVDWLAEGACFCPSLASPRLAYLVSFLSLPIIWQFIPRTSHISEAAAAAASIGLELTEMVSESGKTHSQSLPAAQQVSQVVRHFCKWPRLASTRMVMAKKFKLGIVAALTGAVLEEQHHLALQLLQQPLFIIFEFFCDASS